MNRAEPRPIGLAELAAHSPHPDSEEPENLGKFVFQTSRNTLPVSSTNIISPLEDRVPSGKFAHGKTSYRSLSRFATTNPPSEYDLSEPGTSEKDDRAKRERDVLERVPAVRISATEKLTDDTDRQALQQIRRAASAVGKKLSTSHPYGTLSAARHLPLTKETVDTILCLAPVRDDLNLRESELESLRAIRRVALMTSGRVERLEDADKLLSYSGSLLDSRPITSRISRRETSSLPLTTDLLDITWELKPENVDEELGLHGDDRLTSPPPAETFEWLRGVRDGATDMMKSFITITSAGRAYLTSNALEILHHSSYPSYDDSLYWITLIEECWMPLFIARTASIESLDIRNYMTQWMKNLPSQIYLSKHVPSFTMATHSFFTALFESRVPGLLRLLLRLNGAFMFESRINICGHIGAEGHPLDVGLKSTNSIADALRYNVAGLHALWPFFFEFPEINVEEMAMDFMKTPFFKCLLNLIPSSPLLPSTAQLVVDVLRLYGDMVMSSHSKTLTARLVTPFASPALPERKTSEKKKPALPPVSTFHQIIEGLGNDQFEIEIVNELVILIADILYLSCIHDIQISTEDITNLISRLDRQVRSLTQLNFNNVRIEIYEDVRIRSSRVLELYQVMFNGRPNMMDIFPFTSSKRIQSYRPQLKSPTASRSRNMIPHDGRYVIPCWRRGCGRIQNGSRVDGTFFYCQL